jgi:hypothetical protein
MTGVAALRGTIIGDSAARPGPANSPSGSDRDPMLPPIDDTAETNDQVTTLAQAVSKRAQVMLLRTQSMQQDLQLRIDRMKADFNAAQEERSEQLREMNALRDMAVEQGKKDDEILKKYITMI